MNLSFSNKIKITNSLIIHQLQHSQQFSRMIVMKKTRIKNRNDKSLSHQLRRLAETIEPKQLSQRTKPIDWTSKTKKLREKFGNILHDEEIIQRSLSTQIDKGKKKRQELLLFKSHHNSLHKGLRVISENPESLIKITKRQKKKNQLLHTQGIKIRPEIKGSTPKKQINQKFQHLLPGNSSESQSKMKMNEIMELILKNKKEDISPFPSPSPHFKIPRRKQKFERLKTQKIRQRNLPSIKFTMKTSTYDLQPWEKFNFHEQEGNADF